MIILGIVAVLLLLLIMRISDLNTEIEVLQRSVHNTVTYKEVELMVKSHYRDGIGEKKQSPSEF